MEMHGDSKGKQMRDASNLALAKQIEELRQKNNEDEAKLRAVADVAAMNSPSNFPISSVRAHGFITINAKGATMFSGTVTNNAALMMLIAESPQSGSGLALNPMMLGGVPVEGVILGTGTNRRGEFEIIVDFTQANWCRAKSDL
jgi:hypothetical protein